jgi:hypothetical protein
VKSSLPKKVKDEISEIRSFKKAIYVHGRIEYEDAFKRKRFTNFRLVYAGQYPPPPSAVFSFCQEGNETEQNYRKASKWFGG